MNLKAGTIKRIHVDQRIIRQNIRCELEGGVRKPPITVQTSKGSIKAWDVDVHGKSRITYRPDTPLSCGARLWIETRAPVTVARWRPA